MVMEQKSTLKKGSKIEKKNTKVDSKEVAMV